MEMITDEKRTEDNKLKIDEICVRTLTRNRNLMNILAIMNQGSSVFR